MVLESVDKNLQHHFDDLGLELYNASFLISFSGGVDSRVLLDVLIKLYRKYNFGLYLCHINHNFSSNSKEMESFVKEIASSSNIKLLKTNYFWDKSGNFESKSRDFRYLFLHKMLTKHSLDFILTGHHFDDNLETIEMRLGSSNEWSKLLGIRSRIGKVLRPMLNIRKQDIYNYAKSNSLRFIIDESNFDISFARNKARLVTLPNKKRVNVNYEERLIKYYEDSHANLSKLKSKFFGSNLIKTQTNYLIAVNQNEFIDYDFEEKKLILQILILNSFQLFVSKSKSEWVNIINFAISNHKANKFYFISNEIRLSRSDKYFYFDRFFSLKDRVEKMNYNSQIKWCNLKISTKFVDLYDKNLADNEMDLPVSLFNKGVFVRSWRFGDKIMIGDGKTKKVSDIYIDNKSSLLKKYLTPILCNNNNDILWILGYRKKNLEFNDSEEFIRVSFYKEYLYE